MALNETSIIKSTDAIISGFDESKLTAMVLLDMSKAFDSISPEILFILKLKDVGASDTCLQWFRSYLSDQQQVVKINSTLSEPLPLCMVSHKVAFWAHSFLASM